MGAAEKRMDADAFLDWCTRQEERYELDDGVARMMTGATRRHDRLVVNIIASLHQQLRGGPCAPATADTAVRTRQRSIRRPDVTVDCGGSANDDLAAADPRVVFEVLSPSTRQTDLVRKLQEYQELASLAAIVLIEPAACEVLVWMRAGSGDAWSFAHHEAMGDQIDLPMIGAVLKLADVYEGVAFEAVTAPPLPPA